MESVYVCLLQAFRIPLGAVGYYIVAKFTPMTPDGEAGEPVFVISERAAESKYNTFKFHLLLCAFVLNFE